MKVRFGILWAILSVALLVGFPMLLFSTVPGTYTPPAPGSTAAQVPPMPVPSDASAQARAVLTNNAEAPAETEEQDRKAASDVWIAAQIKAFYERHPKLPEKKNPYCPDDVRQDLFDLSFAVLIKIESDKVLMAFVRHSDPAVRAAAIRALDAAQNAMSMDGIAALIDFLSRQSQDDLEWLLRADTEVLIEETRTGSTDGHGGSLMQWMGVYGRPAIPHLVWASDNHPDPTYRTFYMFRAASLDPDAPGIQDMLGRRLSDPDPNVRLNALQVTVTLPIRRYRIEHEQDPPWHLQLRPGDTVPGEGDNVVPVPIERKSVALAAKTS